MLEGIKECLLKIVDIAPASIWRVDQNLDAEWAVQPSDPRRREKQADPFPEPAPLAADERSRPYPAVQVIDRGRVRQLKFEIALALQCVATPGPA